MSVLTLSPDSHAPEQAAATAVLCLHIGAAAAPFLPTSERASVIASVLSFCLVLSGRADVGDLPLILAQRMKLRSH